MRLDLFLFAGWLVPSVFYYFACRLPDRRWLTIYPLFCLTTVAVMFFYPEHALIDKINASDGFVKVRYLLILLLMTTSCIGALVGTISKMVLLKIEREISSLEIWQIHIASLCLVIFTFPFLSMVILIAYQ